MTALLLALAIWASPNASAVDSAVTTADGAINEARATGVPEAQLSAAAAMLEQARVARRANQLEEAKRLADQAWSSAKSARDALVKSRSDNTKFRVAVDPKTEETRVAVDTGGPVQLESGEETVSVPPGHGARAAKGRKVAVGALPATPSLREPADGSEVPWRVPTTPEEKRAAGSSGATARLVDVALRWSAVQQAAGYEVLLSRDAEGRDVVARLTSRTPQAVLQRPLPVGVYYWRVQARNGQGVLGTASEARRLNVTEKPPMLDVNKPVWK